MIDKIISVILIALGTILLVLTFIGDRGYKDLNAVDREIEQLKEKNRDLDSEIAGLNNELYGISETPWKLEKKSRESLGLSKPEDIVYIVESDKKEQTARH